MILHGQVQSRVLGMDTNISVLVPNTFDDERPYQIGYLLHGLWGGNADFVHYTMLPAHAMGRHCVLVMPEVGRSFYADMAFGPAYFKYVAEELPQICRSLFNLSASREDSFVMGSSMGGYGALRCALTYPENYGACCANAPGSLFMGEFMAELRATAAAGQPQTGWGAVIYPDYRAAYGPELSWSEDIELLCLVDRIKNPKAAPRIMINCGTKDDLLEANRRFTGELRKRGFPFTYTEWPGAGHDFDFFDKAAKAGLAFCCDPP